MSTSVESQKNQGNSRKKKKTTSASLTTQKSSTVWITANMADGIHSSEMAQKQAEDTEERDR